MPHLLVGASQASICSLSVVLLPVLACAQALSAVLLMYFWGSGEEPLKASKSSKRLICLWVQHKQAIASLA